MKIEVVKGSVIYKGTEYECGSAFDCEKGVAESLIKGNVARKIDEPADKPAAKRPQKKTEK